MSRWLGLRASTPLLRGCSAVRLFEFKRHNPIHEAIRFTMSLIGRTSDIPSGPPKKVSEREYVDAFRAQNPWEASEEAARKNVCTWYYGLIRTATTKREDDQLDAPKRQSLARAIRKLLDVPVVGGEPLGNQARMALLDLMCVAQARLPEGEYMYARTFLSGREIRHEAVAIE
eukprot:GHVU01004375.1.p1 GENE.GHVU01004375.1~~GHVU01004375.1.p1  ORF type:complete len:173 (-),score=16.72 GHVU01004375.1:416-934(-)